jgi:hypothetical protein
MGIRLELELEPGVGHQARDEVYEAWMVGALPIHLTSGGAARLRNHHAIEQMIGGQRKAVDRAQTL